MLTLDIFFLYFYVFHFLDFDMIPPSSLEPDRLSKQTPRTWASTHQFFKQEKLISVECRSLICISLVRFHAQVGVARRLCSDCSIILHGHHFTASVFQTTRGGSWNFRVFIFTDISHFSLPPKFNAKKLRASCCLLHRLIPSNWKHLFNVAQCGRHFHHQANYLDMVVSRKRNYDDAREWEEQSYENYWMMNFTRDTNLERTWTISNTVVGSLREFLDAHVFVDGMEGEAILCLRCFLCLLDFRSLVLGLEFVAKHLTKKLIWPHGSFDKWSKTSSRSKCCWRIFSQQRMSISLGTISL